MTETFDKAFNLLMRFEGGYVNDPDDPGGETKFGISKRQYPNLDIKNLTKEQAKKIYRKDYYVKAMCIEIERINPTLAIYHFDTAVNTGIKTAGKILQNSLNKQGFGLKVDGVVWVQTLGALGKANIELVLRDYLLNRILYYLKITKRNKTLERFLAGWANRTLKLYKMAG